jgi:hypothetical protein
MATAPHTTSDLVDHFLLEATVLPDHIRYISHKSDITTGRRKIRIEERWRWTKKIGQGSFGTVWLEERIDGETSGTTKEQRAVKAVYKSSCSLGNIDYRRELLTMAKFSRVRFTSTILLNDLICLFE